MSPYSFDDLEVQESTLKLPWCSSEVPTGYWKQARQARKVSETAPEHDIKPAEAAPIRPKVPVTTPLPVKPSQPSPKVVATTPAATEKKPEPTPLALSTSEKSTVTATTATPAPAKAAPQTGPVPQATPAKPSASQDGTKPSTTKSWADLVKAREAGKANVTPESGTVNSSAATDAPSSATTTPTRKTTAPNGGATANSSNGLVNGSPRFRSIADTLANFLPSFQRTTLQPRGLVNSGNMCFMNSILQALLFCPPFFNLLKKIETHSTHSFNSSTPLTDSLVAFVNEFRESKPLPISTAADEVGEPLSPENVYNALRSLKKFDSLRGRQEDAQEFMGFLLEGLHDEFMSVGRSQKSANGAAAEATNGGNGATGAATPYAWMEVGKKNRVSSTRTVAANDSPITQIFGGKQRSVLRCPGSKDSITYEPFQSLLLDISPPAVKTVEDALNHLVQPETLEGFTDPRGFTVQATKQLQLEELPPVLILHINRFVYTSANGAQKLQKPLEYGHHLVLPSTLFPPHHRQPKKPIQYDLLAVVYHHGRHLTGGHYTCDILQSKSQWLNIDDTAIKRIAHETVITQGSDDCLPYVLFYVRN